MKTLIRLAILWLEQRYTVKLERYLLRQGRRRKAAPASRRPGDCADSLPLIFCLGNLGN